jgi:PKD repeat protein
MSKMTFTARGLALLAGVFLGCGGNGGEAPEPSTHHKALAGLESACESARQPRLVAAPTDEAPEGMVLLEGKDLNCGETYELVVTRPDGTSTSESLTADTQGKVQTTYLVDGPPGEHQARLYDSNGEEVAQTLAYGSTFRYGHLTWRTVGPRTAEFSVLNAFRRTYPGSGPDGLAVTGDTFVETQGGTQLCFGDGTCTGTLTYEVTSYNAEQGWLLARAVNPGQPQTQPGTGVVVVETEPNNTLGTANSMQLGEDYLSTLSVSGDSDHVRFTLSQRTRIEVRTQRLTLWNPYLYLYDSTGRLLAYNDDGGGGYNSLITLTLEAGTYYIRAAGYGSSTGQQYVQLRQVNLPPPRPITRTYFWEDGLFTASISGCCRISSLSNPGSSNYRVQTQVRFIPANSSPVSTLAPIIDAPINTPGFAFQIPATDVEGDQLTFRLATRSESSLYSPPPGLTVSSTGLVSWSTVGTWVGELWAAQVIIEERRGGVLIGSSAVDFLLRVTGAPGTAPTCLPPSQTQYTVVAGQPVQFTVGTRDVDAGDTLTLTASGVPAGAALQPALPVQGPSGISTTFSWTPSTSAAGNTYPVRFTVSDSTWRAGYCDVLIWVQPNQPPVANAGPDQVVPEGSTVTLNGGGSSDPEGQALTYQWSVVGSTGPALTLSSPTSATPSFTPSDNGVYTLRLTVTDSQGATGSDTVTVRVDNVAPQVSATGGQVDEGQVFLSAGFFTDPGADAWSARVNYGDGSDWQPLALNQGAFTLSHPYTDNGTFQVQIAVRDDDGGQGTVTVQVEVHNVAPWIVNAPGIVIDQGQPFTSPVTFGDPGADFWQVSVDYGDGRSENLVLWDREFVLQYTYLLPGTYSLTVTIRDEDGGQVTTTIPVVVHNLAPQVYCCDFSWRPTIDEGTWFYAPGHFLDPAMGLDTFTVTVDYGDGTGVQPVGDWDGTFWLEHIYAENGTYLVTVTVTDGFGGVGTATREVEVHNVAPGLEQLQWDYWDVVEGSPSQFWGSIYDPGQDTWTIQVDYGDGTGIETLELTTRGFQLSHTFSKTGEYWMTFTIMDDDGGVGHFQRWIWINNVNPEVSLPESGESIEGSTFRASGSFTDPGQDTWTAWVKYGNYADWQPLPLHGKTFELDHVYADSGYHRVTVAVQDSSGDWSWKEMDVTVHNVAPELSLPESGESLEGSPFVLSGSFTDPGAESYWELSVDYGDGTGHGQYLAANGAFTLEHTYRASGVYTVTVWLWDGEDVRMATFQVVVHNVAPVVIAQGDTVDEGYGFYSLASFIDPGDESGWVATIDYGDGSDVQTFRLDYWYQRDFWLSHYYADVGTYLVTVTVTDDDGGVGSTTVPVVVRNVVPSLAGYWDSDEIHEGGSYTGYGQVLNPSRDTWTVTVDYGDGSAPEELSPSYNGYYGGFELSHVYDDNGLYTVTLTLKDDDGGSATHTVEVWVHNVAPTVTAAHDSPRYWGTPVHLVGTATDPSQADTRAGFTALWTLGDGTTASGLTTAHVYAAPGSYQALLTVKDKDDGWSDTTSTTVTIQPRPGAVTCADMTAVYGTPVALGASFLDGLPGGLPGGRSLSFRLGASTDLGVASTDAMGQARVHSPGELMPGRYVLTVSFAGDSHYSAAEARCTLSVTQSNGTITGGGLRLANNSRGGFNVMLAEGGALKGELQFQSDSTSFHAHTMTALGLSVDKRRGWFAGMGEDGRAFTVYVEDNGEPGSEDVFQLWLDGAPQTGGGALSGGNIQIH